jgi:hypothetical protein
VEKNKLPKNISSKIFNKYSLTPDMVNTSLKNQFKKNDLKLQIFNIAQSNLNMYKRLLACKKSCYNKEKYLKDYKKSQSYKKHSCKYPSIDFYKTLRISNYFSSLFRHSNNEINNNNYKLFMKPKKKKIKKTSYQSLFYSNEINEFNNKKNKLFLEELNLNIMRQNKINEHFKTHYILKDFYTKKDESKKNKEINPASSLNEAKINNSNNKLKINNILFKKRNFYNNLISKTNYKEKLSNNKKIFNGNINYIHLTEKTIGQK